MNTKTRDFSIGIVLLLFVTSTVSAQLLPEGLNIGDTNQVHVLNTKIGDRLLGHVMSIQDTVLDFTLLSGTETQFSLNQIKSLSLKRESSSAGGIEGNEWGYTGTEKVFFTSTAYTLPRGVTEFQASLSYLRFKMGITDELTLSIGSIPWILFVDAELKFGVPLSDNVTFGGAVRAGAMTIREITGDDFFAIYPHTHITFGSRAQNLTLGFGYLGINFFDGNDLEGTNVLSIGGHLPISNRVQLQGEIITGINNSDSGGLVILGGNVCWNQNRLDYGVMVPFSTEEFIIALPTVKYSVRF